MNITLHPVNLVPSQKMSNASVHLAKVDKETTRLPDSTRSPDQCLILLLLYHMSLFSPTPLLTDLRQRRNDVPTDHSPELRILPV